MDWKLVQLGRIVKSFFLDLFRKLVGTAMYFYIPDSIGKLTKLRVLYAVLNLIIRDLGQNSFTGAFHKNFRNLTALYDL